MFALETDKPFEKRSLVMNINKMGAYAKTNNT